MKAAMKKRKAHTAEHTYVHRILSSDRRSLHYDVLWFIINTLTQFLQMILSSTKYMTFTESFSVCQNGIRLTWLDWKLLFLITQLSQSLFEAEAIGFHEGGEEKPEWPSQDFTKNRQLAIPPDGYLRPSLSLFVVSYPPILWWGAHQRMATFSRANDSGSPIGECHMPVINSAEKVADSTWEL